MGSWRNGIRTKMISRTLSPVPRGCSYSFTDLALTGQVRYFALLRGLQGLRDAAVAYNADGKWLGRCLYEIKSLVIGARGTGNIRICVALFIKVVIGE
jgi:hypothetical protein